MALTPRRKLIYCIVGNAIVLLVVLGVCVWLRDDSSKYFRIGPNADLIIISVQIDTRLKYACLLLFLAILNISEVIIQEIGMPVLGFNIYNPDKKVITEFGKLELQIYGNLMFTISGIRRVLMMVVSISQVDVALWCVMTAELTAIFTIRLLLNEKAFTSSNPTTLGNIQMEEV